MIFFRFLYNLSVEVGITQDYCSICPNFTAITVGTKASDRVTKAKYMANTIQGSLPGLLFFVLHITAQVTYI